MDLRMMSLWLRLTPDLADTASFCEEYEWPPEHGANCVVVEAKRGSGETTSGVSRLADNAR